MRALRTAALPTLACLASLLLLGGCERYDPLAGLNEAELEAVDRLTRDPWVRLWRTERNDAGELVVWTRQGEERIRYRVVPDPEDPEGDWLIRRIGDHPVLRRGVSRGGGSAEDFDRRRWD